MRSWSQPTESTCRPERSCDVKRLWVWQQAVLKSVLKSKSFFYRRIGFDIAFHFMRASFARLTRSGRYLLGRAAWPTPPRTLERQRKCTR